MAEDHVPGGRPVGAATPVAAPQWPWVVLFALFGAALTAYGWATACPAKPVGTFWVDQARGMGGLLGLFALAGALAGKPWDGLLMAVQIAPLYLVGLVPPVGSMTVGWEGGWMLGIAGAAEGAAAGAATGWLFIRWTLPGLDNRDRQREKATRLPIAFAVFFAIFGAINWGIDWVTADHGWAIGVLWILLALPGILVARPFLGLLVMSPLILLTLVPLVASMTVGWEGGWILGSAGAAAGAAAGASTGWLFNRWIMPEYDKRRARERAVRPPSSTAGRGSSDSIAKHS